MANLLDMLDSKLCRNKKGERLEVLEAAAEVERRVRSQICRGPI